MGEGVSCRWAAREEPRSVGENQLIHPLFALLLQPKEPQSLITNFSFKLTKLS